MLTEYQLPIRNIVKKKFDFSPTNAFSMTELLVVMAILSLLIALLFPVFEKVKKSAKASVCLNNLHQIGNQFSLYTSNFDDKFPFAVDEFTRDNPEAMSDFNIPANLVPDLLLVLNSSFSVDRNLWKCPLDVESINPADWGLETRKLLSNSKMSF